jgi:ribosomal protein S6--L-glutamate ligase
VELSEEYINTAVRCTQILGLQVAGVDMLEGKDGPQVMEINSSPGLEGIETATGLDVAGAVIDYIAAQVDFPEVDVRQRLTVSKGYGVSEIYLPEGSKFVNQSILDTGLAESDINVLTLYRGAKVIPNPKSSRLLEADDKLLCFGKLESMRGMIPARTRRRRRPEVQELDTDLAR